MGKAYKNPPLKETLFEIRFPAELSIECQRDQFYEKVRKELPQIFVPSIAPFESASLKSYEFKSSDGMKVVKCSINSMSFHSGVYGDFSVFERECNHYVQTFIDLYKIKSLKRTGLRYINHIPVVRVAGSIPLDKLLNFKYVLPKEIPTQMDLFHTIFITKLGDGKLRLWLQSVSEPSQAEYIIVDFDHFYDTEIPANKYKENLSKSHAHIKDEIFLNLLSKEYLDALEKGAI